MLRIKHFQPGMNVKEYIPCLFPHYSRLYELSGLQLDVRAIPALSLLSLPTYSRSEDLLSTVVNIWDGRRLGYKGSLTQLGIGQEKKEAASFEQGMELLKHNITTGMLMLVCGSMYQLPYSNEYKNLNVYPHPYLGLTEHWLSLYGVSGQEVLVYDPIPNHYQGSLALHHFKEFWEGDRFVPELSDYPGIHHLSVYGYYELELYRKVTDEEMKSLMFKAFQTVTYEYVSGRVIEDHGISYYFGRSAVAQLLEDLASLSKGEAQPAAIIEYEKHIVSSKYSRYFFRDLLEAMSPFGAPFTHYLNTFLDIIKDWDMVSNLYVLYLKRSRSSFDFLEKIVTLLQELSRKESAFFEKLYMNHQGERLMDKIII
ncbi:hypothetical protein K0T92_05975 [Paenibacillus oenotherae]|uniref:Uncharacterized protein n=1 Tax=Paenibacillus oenotherae TaxID=1435645 RepID=A0ABS7D321_9BACL|nr:hypothetical protein [Paenibacillus oenotherae]MBW7474285.1 hypothetical protein [Paenibacillus oenotherae]